MSLGSQRSHVFDSSLLQFDWKACFLSVQLILRALARRTFFSIANHMIGFLLSGAKTHSKFALYPNRKV